MELNRPPLASKVYGAQLVDQHGESYILPCKPLPIACSSESLPLTDDSASSESHSHFKPISPDTPMVW